jgi:hypothetical protein
MNELAELRKANLRAIVERDGLTSAARRFQKPDRQLNDMLAGRKSFGEKVARAMERSYDPSLPPGWLDLPPDAPPLPEPSNVSAGLALSPAERALIDAYRLMASADQEEIKRLAEEKAKRTRELLSDPRVHELLREIEQRKK